MVGNLTHLSGGCGSRRPGCPRTQHAQLELAPATAGWPTPRVSASRPGASRPDTDMAGAVPRPAASLPGCLVRSGPGPGPDSRAGPADSPREAGRDRWREGKEDGGTEELRDGERGTEREGRGRKTDRQTKRQRDIGDRDRETE